MGTSKRQTYLRKLLMKRARDARIWPEFSKAVKEYQNAILAAGGSKHTSRLRAYMRAAEDFPALDLEGAKASYWAKVKGGRAGRKTITARRISAKLPAAKAALLEMIAEEEVRQEELKRQANAREKLRQTKRRILSARLRKAITQAKKEEARVEANKAKARHYYMIKKLKEDEMRELQEAEAAKAEAKKHGVVVADPDQVDVLRDVRWVYSQMAKLIIIDPVKNHRKLNVEMLQQAPSNGAIALAMYALDDSKAFIDKFAVKLLPRDAGAVPQSEDSAKLQEELDPGFGDLEQYIKG